MDCKEFHALNNKINEALKYYVLRNDYVDDKYYVAKMFLSEISELGYRNAGIRNLAGDWLKKGGTLRLQQVLKFTSYNYSLLHFNAMSLIDSVRVRVIE